MSGIFDSFSGSITGEVLAFNPGAIPEPDTLHIRMTRGERRIADELRKAFGGFRRVIIDVDGVRHEFSADSFIWLLEGYEGARDKNRWHDLFGTPERAARTLQPDSMRCEYCLLRDYCKDGTCLIGDYDALLEWLREEGERE